MSAVMKISRTMAMFLVVGVLALGCASAEVANPYSCVLVGGGNLNLVSEVTQVGGLYHYIYTVSFTTGWSPKPLSIFSLGNEGKYEFFNAGNDSPTNFTVDPTFDPNNTGQDSIVWSATKSVPYTAGRSVKFWFDSYYGYDLVDAAAGGAGIRAYGQALGMVPEPGSLAAMLIGLTGLGGTVLRLRKR